MRRNPAFVLSDVAGEHVLLPAARAGAELNGMLILNDMGISIWDRLAHETTFEALLTALLDEYEVSEETARADLSEYLKILRDVNGIID